jgi:hypothetical protein
MGVFLEEEKIVSMTEQAYENYKWRGLHNLQSALSKTKLGDHHYGYSSAHYNKFDSLSDLVEISFLVLDNTDNIPSSGGEDTFEEMMILAEELQHNADKLSELSSKLRNEAERWAERSWRALSKD